MSVGNKKLLLVNPKYNHVPINCAFIITTLIKNDIEYDFFDMQLDIDLEGKIASNEYYAVAMGGLILNYSLLEDLFERVKKVDPDILTILGGRIIGLSAVYLNKLKIDYLVQEDADPAFPGLLKKLVNGENDFHSIKGIAYRENGELQFTEPADLRSLDGFVPTWKDIDLQYYLDHPLTMGNRITRNYPLIIGMGCVGKCVFCAPHITHYRVRSVASVIAEIKEAVNTYEIDTIAIRSEIFYNDVEDAREFCEEYLATGINKPLIAMIRADVDPEIIGYLGKAGCKFLSIGVEAYHDEALRKMGKGITTEQIDRTIKKVEELGIQFSCGFLIGNPGDTVESIEATADFFVRNKITQHTIGGSGVIIFPGTASYRIAEQMNLIEDEDLYLRRLCQHEPQARLTPDYGLGEIYPNITTLSNDELWTKYSEIYFKMYNYQMEFFSSKTFDWESKSAVCRNCGETINITGSPVTMYICSKCFAPNFVFMHNLLLKKSSKYNEVVNLFKSKKKVVVAGSYNSMYVILDIALSIKKDFSDLIIICDGNVKNHFEAALGESTCINFSELADHDVDGFIHYGLHNPEIIEAAVIGECNISKDDILNATPVEFKKIHDANMDSELFYFEYTFDQDMFEFGKQVGDLLAAEYGTSQKWLLPSNDTYAKAVNLGVEDSNLITEADEASATGAVITTPRLQDSRVAKKRLFKKTDITEEKMRILKGDIYKKLWNDIFIKE